MFRCAFGGWKCALLVMIFCIFCLYWKYECIRYIMMLQMHLNITFICFNYTVTLRFHICTIWTPCSFCVKKRFPSLRVISTHFTYPIAQAWWYTMMMKVGADDEVNISRCIALVILGKWGGLDYEQELFILFWLYVQGGE